MGISIGGVEIACAYLGDTPPSEIYVGDVKVRPIIKDITLSYLIVGGGGGGWGGGGGGGEVLLGEKSLSPGTYNVTIGAGGVGAYAQAYQTPIAATDGGASCFADIVANGGCRSSSVASPGASGSGCAAGESRAGNRYGKGGGGGASGAGCSYSGYLGGNGGPGLCGYGGGGGGSASYCCPYSGRGEGVDGGGSGGARLCTPTNATNCGGGGGGNMCYAPISGAMGGAGGPGLLLVCYPTACGYEVTGGCKYTCGDYTVHCFTSDGTLSF